jgi:hypothetical protein
MLPYFRYFPYCVIKIWAKESIKVRIDATRITLSLCIHNCTLRNGTSTVQYRRPATPTYTFAQGMAVDVLSYKLTSSDMPLESCNKSIRRQQL